MGWPATGHAPAGGDGGPRRRTHPLVGPAGRAARAGNRPTPKSMMICSAPAAASPAGILGTGWAALTNGFPIVYCPPVCEEPRPLTDHDGSIVFGILLPLVAIWSLWRARARPGWFMPAAAAALGNLGRRPPPLNGEWPPNTRGAHPTGKCGFGSPLRPHCVRPHATRAGRTCRTARGTARSCRTARTCDHADGLGCAKRRSSCRCQEGTRRLQRPEPPESLGSLSCSRIVRHPRSL